jgi:hypothetical protein
VVVVGGCYCALCKMEGHTNVRENRKKVVVVVTIILNSCINTSDVGLLNTKLYYTSL